MKLNSTEARLTKTSKIVFGSENLGKYYTMINPLKGSYADLEKEIYKILEINNTSILELTFDHRVRVYLSNAGKDATKPSCYFYAMYPTREEAIECVHDDFYTISIARDWDHVKSKYSGSDVSVSGVIRKGYA